MAAIEILFFTGSCFRWHRHVTQYDIYIPFKFWWNSAKRFKSYGDYLRWSMTLLYSYTWHGINSCHTLRIHTVYRQLVYWPTIYTVVALPINYGQVRLQGEAKRSEAKRSEASLIGCKSNGRRHQLQQTAWELRWNILWQPIDNYR